MNTHTMIQDIHESTLAGQPSTDKPQQLVSAPFPLTNNNNRFRLLHGLRSGRGPYTLGVRFWAHTEHVQEKCLRRRLGLASDETI